MHALQAANRKAAHVHCTEPRLFRVGHSLRCCPGICWGCGHAPWFVCLDACNQSIIRAREGATFLIQRVGLAADVCFSYVPLMKATVWQPKSWCLVNVTAGESNWKEKNGYCSQLHDSCTNQFIFLRYFTCNYVVCRGLGCLRNPLSRSSTTSLQGTLLLAVLCCTNLIEPAI